MKNLIILAMVAVALIIFNGCQKDELVLIDEQPQTVVKPDVYVENGYLAFKNMEAVDSIVTMLSGLNEDEKEVWETQIGFKSARAEFQRLYCEYDKLKSDNELLAFKKKYETILKFEGRSPSDWSVDYPFATGYFIPVLNKDGIYKVGKSVIKYTMYDQIIILDGDLEKLNNLDKFNNNEMIVFMSRLKSSGDNRIYLDDFEDDNLDPKRYDKWSYSSSGQRCIS